MLIGISELLKLEQASYYERLLTCALHLVNLQETEEEKKIIGKDKRQLMMADNEEDDLDDDEQYFEVECKDTQERLKSDVNMTLGTIFCQIKQIDEYNYFASVMRLLLKKTDISSHIANLSKQNQDVLQKALYTKRVSVSMKNGLNSIGRRIIKPKRPAKGIN